MFACNIRVKTVADVVFSLVPVDAGIGDAPGAVATISPQPPSARALFQPGAEGPEHQGRPAPELAVLGEEDGEGSPNMAKSEKLDVVQVTVFALVSTMQPLSACQVEPS